LRLQHLKPQDVIKVVGQGPYDASGVLNAQKKRNNFFYLGEALRQILTGGVVHFSNPSLQKYKDFIAQKEVNYRAKVMDMVMAHKPKEDVLNFS
jgi:hypothetical protein